MSCKFSLPLGVKSMTSPISLASAIFILLTVFFAVAGQVIMRWQVSKLPSPGSGVLEFIYGCMCNMSMWIVVILAFLSMGCWSIVLNRVPLNVAYPFTSLSFLGVLLSSWVFLGEIPSYATVLGVFIICIGVSVIGIGAK